MKAALVSLSLFIMLGSSALFFLMMRGTYAFTLDDSFISFRYASHIAEGSGLVWNVGEKIPNEGYTSILWVVILAAAQRAGFEVVTASKLLGIMFTLLTACICFWSVYSMNISSSPAYARLLAGAVAASFFITNINLSALVTSGMETSVSIFVITLFFVSVADYLRSPAQSINKALIVGLLALLGGLSRPEFNLGATVTLLILIYISAQHRKYAIYSISLYVVCGLAYFIWRYNYFGLLMPLPFYIKQIGAHTSRFPGLSVVIDFVKSLWPLYLFLGLFVVTLRKENRIWLPAAIGVAINIIYFILPEHIMGDYFRFLFPVYPALAIFAGLGILKLWDILNDRPQIYTIVTGAICLLFFLFQIRDFAAIEEISQYGVDLKRAHVYLGKILADIDPSGKSVVAIGDAGAVPYYSKWNTLDTFGLNNREIALMRSKNLYAAGTIMSKYQPDILVLISFKRDVFEPRLQHEQLLYDESIKLKYIKAGTIEFDATNGYTLWIMTREAKLFDAFKYRGF